MARSDGSRRGSLRRLGAGLFVLLAAGCAGGARWDAHAVVRPAGGAWDHADIRVQGSRPPGADMGDACTGAIAVVDKGVTRRLEVRVAAQRAVVTGTAPAGLVLVGSALDTAALRAAGPAISPAEAEDLLRMFDGACAGPKAGFPTTATLVVVVAEQFYT